MAYPSAPGTRAIGSDTMRMIPVLYSGKLLKKYYNETILTMVTNTDYEGEIRKHGDTVYIRTLPTITIRDYVKGAALINEQPESTSVELQIDKGKYWSFVSEELDKVQTDIKDYVTRWATDGARQLEITLDTDVLAGIAPDATHQGASAGLHSEFNFGATGTPVELDKTNVLEYLVDMGTCLDQYNVPQQGRFVVLPPRICGLIKKSDLKDASLSGDPKSTIRSGVVGTIDRFTIINSNLLPYVRNDTAYKCLFGVKDGATFATQMTASKVQDNPNGFGMLHRALNVYGYKVVKPEALGVLYAKV
jgi:hypothetical protein